MAKFSAIVTDRVGLHARPASVLAKEASKFTSDIKIISGDKTGNIKSIMNVMAMAIKSGAEITIEATGVDAEEAIVGIKAAMIANGVISG
ncbi:phosphocarrier protein HPr [Williamsoniiplasma luminosum]|uniref:Phosphocarrier protein HPr n=1 Tax=Williamsoniiplasma luminosum TaxID=214888 RepID=A0A2K8NUC3_9MOLU|nr:HPr family phosphocarrier protein [Williamsoniiplasma luminosum]ATZ16768.1 phosphocarrier protein HPr [Williamsoniiplasma luminosum]AVP49448.1 MAG: HPr family phosphocarrier protein [Williamsoniiplasma luminosum]